MKFRVENLGEEPTAHRLVEGSDWFSRLGLGADANRVTYQSPIQFDLLLSRSDRDVHVRGTVGGKVEIACSRCLTPHGYPFSADFQALLVPESSSPAAKEREQDRDSLEVTVYSGPEVDLDTLLREQVLLALPVKPLCRPECRGLCPRCGTNLNELQCPCESPRERSSFEALRKLTLDHRG
ncbi:MAG: YceD family protein [Vicinamibacteria bacterium]